MKKIIKNNLLGFIMGAVIFTGVGVYAAGYLAKDITYNKNGQATVEDALNDLYNKKKINLENIELINNYDYSNNSVSISPSNYEFFIITNVFWDSKAKTYSSGINYLSISSITNGTYYESGLTGRNGGASAVAGRSYIIVPDGSNEEIVVTFAGTSDSTSIYGIKK